MFVELLCFNMCIYVTYSILISWYNYSNNLPFSWRSGAIGLYNNELHIIGGINENNIGYNEIKKYNFSSQLWTYITITDPDFETFELWNPSYTQIGNVIYWIPKNCASSCNVANPRIFSYNMSNGEIQRLKNGLGGSGTGAVCSDDNYVYAIGGWVLLNPNPDFTLQHGAYKYEIMKDAWMNIQNMLVPSAQANCIKYDKYVYVFGGNTNHVAPFGAIQYWDEDDNMWFQNINSLRDSYPNGITLQVQELQIIDLTDTGACDDCILLLGGVDRGGHGALNTVWQYIFGILPLNDSISIVDGIPNPSVNGATVINPVNNNIFGPIGGATIQDGNSDFSYSFGCIAGVSDGSPCNASTDAPTQLPTIAPTVLPTIMPSISTDIPSITPSNIPSMTPTSSPTKTPTNIPSKSPASDPTSSPTLTPTVNPTSLPTITPSHFPSFMPTLTVVIPDEAAMFLSLPIYSLYIIISVLLICIIIIALLLCYFCGQSRRMKQKMEDQQNMTVELQKRLDKSDEMLKSLSSIEHSTIMQSGKITDNKPSNDINETEGILITGERNNGPPIKDLQPIQQTPQTPKIEVSKSNESSNHDLYMANSHPATITTSGTIDGNV